MSIVSEVFLELKGTEVVLNDKEGVMVPPQKLPTKG